MKMILVHGLGQTTSSWNETITFMNEETEIFCPNGTSLFLFTKNIIDILLICYHINVLKN